MEDIESLIYSAHSHGKRDQLFKLTRQIRDKNPYMPLEEVYDKAYQQVMKT